MEIFKLKIMEQVVFLPWVGKNYTSPEVKILILGESHYSEDADSFDSEKEEWKVTTIKTIEKYLEYKKGECEHQYWMNTFTKFTNVFFGEQVDNERLIEFWNSVIFYNYIQQPIEGPRIKPTEEAFDRSISAFYEVLNVYQPDILFAWGHRLWDQTPNEHGGWEENTYQKGKLFFYNIADKKILATFCYHPSSSAFSYKETENLKKALDWVEQNKSLK